MTTPSIMSYIPGSVITGWDGTRMVPDFARNQLYFLSPGSNPTSNGIGQYTGYPTGAETLEQSLGHIGVGDNLPTGPHCLTPSGYLVYNLDDSNSTTIVSVRASDLIAVSTFGAESGDTDPSTSSRILCPGSIAPVAFGLYNYAILSPSAENKGEVCLMTIPGMLNNNLGRCTEEGGAICGPGNIGTSEGTAYVLASPTSTTADFGLYEVTVPAQGFARIGGFGPADIDATWTHITNFAGLAYDQTDGNVLAMFATSDSVTNTNYMVKLSTSTGAVLWATPVPNFDAYGFENMSKALIQNGLYYYLDGATLHTFDTATGVDTQQAISILEDPDGQISEDASGSIICHATWIEDTTVPNYIGINMGPPGNNHGPTSATWFRFWPGAIGPIPPVPGGTGGPPAVSNYKAWTYVLDGHTFYVLDLGAQGTFVYDFVTQQWSNFTTGTPSAPGTPNPEWNFINGWQWQDRIVGGDIATPDLWEMNPSAMLDNDVTEIAHVSTGAIAVRSRVFHSCDAVRVMASFGIIDDVSGTVFNLRFSDDQEKTWSEYFTITLSEGAYDTEIAWRSLGSFCAPGRIFELSDTGGLIRIDGLDVFIDGFDNDPQDQNQPRV